MNKTSATKEIDFYIKKFDLRLNGDNKIIVFIGKRNTGKSCLVLDYLYHNQDIPIGTVISPTDDFNMTYKPHIPSIFIHEEYSPELIENFLKRQKDIVRKTKREPQYRNVDPRAFLILDDCLYDNKSWINDRNIKWIFMNGRHAHVTFLLTMQYSMGIPPALRTNVDYIFICKEPKVSNRKRLYDHYAGIFPSYDMFCQVLTACTQSYGCLVINNSSTSDKLEEQVFYYRAEKNHFDSNFKMCLEEFWINNEEYMYAKDEMHESDDSEVDDYAKYTNNRNKINFRINQC